MVGWECPKCGRVYAPFIACCAVCPRELTATIGTFDPTRPTYACTCGTSVRCPLHLSGMTPTTFCETKEG